MPLAVRTGLGIAATVKSRLDGADHVVTHDSVPLATADLTWVVGGAMNADTDYASVDCQRFSTIWLEFIMSPASDPVGSLFIEQSMDNSTFYPFAIDVGKFALVGSDPDIVVVEASGKITLADPAAETRIFLGVEKPPPFMRGRWDDTTGGSATGMAAKNFGRA
ncbi:MAG: hypothetical protein V3R71_06385 [Gemmatimonadales bacterium]